MSLVPTPPVVDLRERRFADEARALLRELVGRAPEPRSPDGALVQLFARMANEVAERVNRAPDKNFVAFLDLLGLELGAPRPARVPLTFSLAKGATEEARVPAGTQVTATPGGTDKDPVLFETEAELVLTPATLAQVLVRDPARDAWADRTASAVGAAAEGFAAFAADLPVPHRVHVDLASLLAAEGPRTLTLTALPAEEGGDAVPWLRWLAWSLLAADGAHPLAGEAADRSWRGPVPEVPETELDGRRGRWLRAELTVPLRADGRAPAAIWPAPDAAGTVRPFTVPPAELLVCSEVLGMVGARAWVEVEMEAQLPPSDVRLAWEYARGQDEWAPLDASPLESGDTAPLRDRTLGLTRSGRVEFTPPADWTETEAGGTRGFWLRVRLADVAFLPPGPAPAIRRLTLGYALPAPRLAVRAEVAMESPAALPPVAQANGAPLDLSKDFLPLGAVPRFGDVFVLALPGLGDKPGAEVAIDVELSNPGDEAGTPPPATPTDDLVLAWEFLVPATGRWEPLGQSGPAADPSAARFGFEDGTEAFASPEPGPRRIRFTRPPEMGEAEVAGTRACWVRARVAAGAYGYDAQWVREVQTMEYVVPVRADDAASIAQATPDRSDGTAIGDDESQAASGDASESTSDEESSSPDSSESSDSEGSSDDASHEDASHDGSMGGGVTVTTDLASLPAGWTTIRQTMQIEIPRLEEATHSPPSIRSLVVATRLHLGPAEPDAVVGEHGDGVDEPAEGKGGPALLLGFSRPGSGPGFRGLPLSLFVAVEEPCDTGVPLPRPAAPSVEWEYWSGAGWAHLEADDGTEALTRRGVVTLVVPADAQESEQLARRAFWVRARWAGGGWTQPPRIGRILPNTVWAAQGETVSGETLGSATGEPSQGFRVARVPVLPGAELEVREPVAASVSELGALEREVGRGAVRVVPAAPGRLAEVWVRWTAVADFHGSGQGDRHYVLDSHTGAVVFGDGVRGMVPPAGSGNVRLARYRTGGGTRGNRPAGTATQLKTALPYVAAVTNPFAAEGGAEAESVGALQARGPLWLRHRNRAVALADYADLARMASAEVAVAFAHLPGDVADAGRVRVTIVPRGQEDQPIPSLGLVEQVRAYLAERASPTVEVVVAGPQWRRVEVEAEVSAVSSGAIFGLAERVRARIQAFLHPLTGGADGTGWAPGQRPHKSELYAVIEDTEGVHHLDRLRVVLTPPAEPGQPGRVDAEDLLVFSGQHRVTVGGVADHH